MKIRSVENTPPPVNRTFRLEMDLSSNELAILRDAVRNHAGPDGIAYDLHRALDTSVRAAFNPRPR